MSLLGDIMGGGVGLLGMDAAQDSVKNIGRSTNEGMQTLADQAVTGTQFNPFSVVSGTGNTSVGADGSINASLSNGQQNASDAALGSATGLLSNVNDNMTAGQMNQTNSALNASTSLANQASQGLDSRTNEIFSSAQAAMQPGFDRAQSQMNNDLYSSGRTGFKSATFGGSSEQYANASAKEDALMSAFFGARTQAGQEQGQQANAAAALASSSTHQGTMNSNNMLNTANAGNTLLNTSLTGEAQLFNNLAPAINVANLGQTGQIAGANLGAQLGMTGLEAEMAGEIKAADLEAGMFNAGSNVAASFGNAIAGSDTAGNIADSIMDWF
jgi:hypothetical protein